MVYLYLTNDQRPQKANVLYFKSYIALFHRNMPKKCRKILLTPQLNPIKCYFRILSLLKFHVLGQSFVFLNQMSIDYFCFAKSVSYFRSYLLIF